MRNAKRRLGAGGLGLASLAVLMAGAPAMAEPKGTVTIAQALLRQMFDPTLTVAIPDFTNWDMMYDGLLNLGPQGKFPALAESWTVSAD
ncbi:MAG: hypothetical protein KIT81_14040, partial [Alphaproteobacteria bacterium]|nr:hypothetical protein [Alphaproteobacteria bacterium]